MRRGEGESLRYIANPEEQMRRGEGSRYIVNLGWELAAEVFL